MSLEKILPNWIMRYITIEHVRARCDICGMRYRLFETLTHFTEHIVSEHNGMYESIVCQEGGYDWVWKIFYITEDNYAKCSLCNITYRVPAHALEQIRSHLISRHYTYENSVTSIRKFLNNYFIRITVRKKKCRICGFTYYNNKKSLILLRHLIWHKLHTSPNIEL